MLGSPIGGSCARQARIRRGAAGLAVAATLSGAATGGPACALIAGLEPHTLEVADAGSGGASGTERAWPDSPTAYCSTGLAETACPTAVGAPFHGQDGDFRIHVPVYQATALTVTDAVTGLMWRRAPLPSQTQQQALSFCASQPYAGFDDWRLPTRIELVTIVDYGATGARIDHVAFPDVTAAPLWSATAYLPGVPVGSTFWGVDLGCSLACTEDTNGSANTDGLFSGTPEAALCVRGAAFRTGDFGPASDGGTITDKSTGLVWQIDPVSQTGSSWTDALHQCRDVLNGEKFGGFDDWRLPNIKELQTIVDDGAKIEPAVFAALPSPQQEYFWSSTPDTDVVSPVHLYVMQSGDGSATTLTTADTYGLTRCVRGP